MRVKLAEGQRQAEITTALGGKQKTPKARGRSEQWSLASCQSRYRCVA